MGWNYLSIPKLQRCNRWSLGMDKYIHPTFYNGCNYLSMLGLKLNHVSKRGHRNIIYALTKDILTNKMHWNWFFLVMLNLLSLWFHNCQKSNISLPWSNYDPRPFDGEALTCPALMQTFPFMCCSISTCNDSVDHAVGRGCNARGNAIISGVKTITESTDYLGIWVAILRPV